MVKGKEEFLEHFARLGVFSKVSALAGPQDAPPEPEAEPSSSVAQTTPSTTTNSEEQKLEDAKELLVGKAYHWRDWCICRGRDCLYVWSDAAALELSNGSNGWFRFILDGKLATMYSSGSPEGGTDTTGIVVTFLIPRFFFLVLCKVMRCMENFEFRACTLYNAAKKCNVCMRCVSLRCAFFYLLCSCYKSHCILSSTYLSRSVSVYLCLLFSRL